MLDIVVGFNGKLVTYTSLIRTLNEYVGYNSLDILVDPDEICNQLREAADDLDYIHNLVWSLHTNRNDLLNESEVSLIIRLVLAKDECECTADEEEGYFWLWYETECLGMDTE